MARCEDTGKFESYDGLEIEIDSTEVDDEGLVNIDITVNRTCAGCGGYHKTASISEGGEVDLDAHNERCREVIAPGSDPDADDAEDIFEDRTWSVVNESAEELERTETKDRKGRPIKNPRYMRTYLGATVTVEVQCSLCERTEDVVIEAVEQASGFEDA